MGKLSTCDVCITCEEVPSKISLVISRRHFSITRIQHQVLGKTYSAVELTDLSMNGTFINGKKVGKGLSKHLEDNDVIAFGKPQFKGKTPFFRHLFFELESGVATRNQGS